MTNQRLVALDNGQVTFRWKDYTHGHQLRTMPLDAVEFLRRFVLHILPRGFQRIRHFGFLANRVRQAKLAQCRTLLHQPAPPSPSCGHSHGAEEATPVAEELAPVCPVCHQGHLRVVATLPPHRAARDLAVPLPRVDTS